MAHPPMPELLAVAGPSYSKGMQSLSCAQRSSSGQLGAAARAAAFARAQRVAFRDACQLWSFNDFAELKTIRINLFSAARRLGSRERGV